MTAQTPNSCHACQKSSLSLLLLRPSPIPKGPDLRLAGGDAIQTDAAVLTGVVPTRAPTESRFGLRLLREGYVHVYIPAPPPRVKHWQVFRVTAQADLIPESNPLFAQPGKSVACNEKHHNPTGLKLLELPQAHAIKGSIWIAYSANLWNDALRKKNAGNKAAMQEIKLSGGSPNSFKPTQDALKSKVIECALERYLIGGANTHDFPFNSLASQTEKLADDLAHAAARHPQTKGHELAVVLRDPVGVATELNALRLRRNELALQEIEKPENAHPLNSSNMLLGMQQGLLDANLADSFKQVAPLKTKTAFLESRKNLPSGTEWLPLSDEERIALRKAASNDNPVLNALLSPYKKAFTELDLGRVIYPDHDSRAAAWAKEQAEKTWAPIATKIDETQRQNWLKAFNQRMKIQHYDPLARFEADWLSAARDASTLDYFKLHFDALDPNNPTQLHSPGLTYARESQYIHSPAPVTEGVVLDDYLKLLEKPASDEGAIVLRAAVGNQGDLLAYLQSLLDTAYKQMTGDPGSEGMRDKASDLLKGLYKETGLKKYSWLGDVIAVFSVGQFSALGAAATQLAARSASLNPTLTRALGRLQGLWCVQRILESAAAGALNKIAPKVPLLVTMNVDVGEALEILRARNTTGQRVSKNAVQRMRRGGKVRLTLLTDTDALKAAQGDAVALMKDKSVPGVSAGPHATDGAKLAAGAAVVLTPEQFARLYAGEAQAGGKAAQALRKALQQNVADVRAIALTMDGRLALGSVFVQGLGLVYGLKGLANATDAKAVRDAWYGIYDSTAGTLGGLLEVWSVAVTSRVLAMAGTEGAAKSVGLGALRFGGAIAGAAGGVANAVSLWTKSKEARAAGDDAVANLYKWSATAFIGTAASSVGVGVGVVANTLVARGIGGVAARGALVRMGLLEAGEILGLSLSGWGLLLLGAGVIFQVGGMAITPTPIQKWAGRSYFGKDDDKFPKGDWAAERKALEEVLNQGQNDAAKEAKAA